MREILFRGKRIDNGQWAYGYYTKGFLNPGWEQLKDMIYIFSGEPKHYDFDYAVVAPGTVGQYTGLTDKHGKKVFQGDIIKTIYANASKKEFIETVVFSGGSFKGMYDIPGGGKMYSPLADSVKHFSDDKSVYMFEMEVIGNIYDNPELLTKESHEML